MKDYREMTGHILEKNLIKTIFHLLHIKNVFNFTQSAYMSQTLFRRHVHVRRANKFVVGT